MSEALSRVVTIQQRLQPYHYAWLEFHPNRTEKWLRERLVDGFDVHHVDGDRSNNSPMNLVLIEYEDHNRLHGFPEKFVSRMSGRKSDPVLDERCYEARLAGGRTWKAIEADVLGLKDLGHNAFQAAKRHAAYVGAAWPIKSETNRGLK